MVFQAGGSINDYDAAAVEALKEAIDGRDENWERLRCIVPHDANEVNKWLRRQLYTLGALSPGSGNAVA